MELIIPKKVSLNACYAGIHWAKRKKLADLYHVAVKVALIQAKLPQIEEFPVDMTYEFTFKRNALDSSNCAFMAKMCEDALVANGYLPDDTPKYVRSVKFLSKKGNEDLIKISCG